MHTAEEYDRQATSFSFILNVFKTWSLIFKEENKLLAFENNPVK
jgi:hypothetical protein